MSLPRVAALAALVSLAGAAFAQAAADPRLHTVFGAVDPLAGLPGVPPALAAPAGGRLFVVQFATAIQPAYARALAARRLSVVGYLPANAYVVRGLRADAEALRSLPSVRWVGPLPLAWKLRKALQPLAAAPPAGGAAIACDLLLADQADEGPLCAQIRALGGELVVHGPMLVRARLAPAALRAVAALDTVLWIDPSGTPEPDMDDARTQGGANWLEATAGMTGQGVRGEITEGVEETHVDFAGRQVLLHYDGLDAHGHCTAGIVFGGGASIAGARGMLPGGTMIEAAVQTWSFTRTRYQLVQESVSPALPWQAMFQTASWGDAPLTLDYTASSAELDQAIFDGDLPITQSQGNAGTQSSRAQAWAKNVIAVGGVVHNGNSNPLDDTWAHTASIGPAADGRIKPDLCAYDDAVLTSDLTGAAGFTPFDYNPAFGGTSAATPIVAGHLGLLLQMFTDGLFGNPLPLPATAANRFANRPHFTTSKALLIDGAAQYAFSGLQHDLTRTHQGWGFPDVRAVYEQRDRLLLVDEYFPLQQGQARTQIVWVAPGTAEFRATMVYADPAALPLAAFHRVNDLDLQVVQQATGTAWWGNQGLLTGTASTPGGSADDRNTVENVILPNPAPGIYFVTVSATSVVRDGHLATPAPDVAYALACRPLGGGHRRGTFDLLLTSLRPGDATLTCSNVPAAGWSEGFTFVSHDTSLPPGFGDLFGLEIDSLLGGVLAQPAAPGALLHFTNVPGQYPFAPFALPPAVALALSGLGFDALVVLLDGTGAIAGMSNVSRCTIR